MNANSKLILQTKNFYDWCIASSANFNKGVATKKVLACLHKQNKNGFFRGTAFFQPIKRSLITF